MSIQDFKTFIAKGAPNEIEKDRAKDFMEDEMLKLKHKVDETFNQIQALTKMGSGPGSSRDITALTKHMELKFAEIEEKLSEKANKQSVAQALHRKANKPEIDALVAKKVDFEDM